MKKQGTVETIGIHTFTAVDNNLTLVDAGLTDKCQVDLVPLE